jgi:DNA-directed RNA polymerase specialized sigma24 family protein
MLRQHADIGRIDAEALQVAIGAAQIRSRRLQRRLGAGWADAEDFQQDLLLDLIGRSDDFDPSRGSWPAFICVVTRNAAVKIAQRHIRLASSTVPLGPEHDLADDRSLVGSEDFVIDVQRALRRLPPDLQDLVSRIADKGDIASAKHAPPGSRASFYRALRNLRLHLVAQGVSRRTKPPKQTH